jgi:superoxide reductase
MREQKEIYRCGFCGNIIEVLHGAGGKLICCEQEMIVLKENTTDAAVEKHVPVIERNSNTVTVRVGSVAHPMDENHYIEFIEIITDSRVYREFLKPGGNPETAFDVEGDVLNARAYCNLHGLWKNE